MKQEQDPELKTGDLSRAIYSGILGLVCVGAGLILIDQGVVGIYENSHDQGIMSLVNVLKIATGAVAIPVGGVAVWKQVAG